ncbi:ABC transporter substrate-binding protein [Nocardia sp. NPDC057030]|uniref:ABC transporter substrate-binding protein n=1 Tax=unclassified Nocardia TaxID=2637762 RepID=UPI003639E0C8
MSRISLVYGGCDYWDRTRPLIDGRVRPEGIDLTFVTINPDDLGRRCLFGAEFAACEMYAVSYMILRARGDDRFVGLPIFPSRTFRHHNIFLRSDAGIEEPNDLRGKRIGIAQYSNTASVWARAALQHDYDVAPTSIEWVEGGFVVPGTRNGHADIEFPPGLHVSRNDTEPLEELLLGGRLDGLIHYGQPRAFTAGDPRVVRLFPNSREVERAYFVRTGLFPIMHVVVLRREVYERHPWMANSLVAAFSEAKAMAARRLHDTSAIAAPLPWLSDDLDEIASLFADAPFHGDPFPYGFEANHATLDTMTTYLREQGLTSGKLDPRTLFAPQTLIAPLS